MKAKLLEQGQLINAISSSAGEIPDSNEEVRGSSAPFVDGKMCKITYDALNFKSKYVDEYTGEVLDPKRVRDAIID